MSQKLVHNLGNIIALRPDVSAQLSESVVIRKIHGWGEPPTMYVENAVVKQWDIMGNPQDIDSISDNILTYFAIGESYEDTCNKIILSDVHAYAAIFEETGWGQVIANAVLQEVQHSLGKPTVNIQNGVVQSVEFESKDLYFDLLKAYVNQEALMEESRALWKQLWAKAQEKKRKTE